MHRPALALLATVCLALTGCSHAGGSSTIADPGACKSALADNYRKAVRAGGKGPAEKRPAACVGLDAKTLEKITGQVISEYLESDQASKDVASAIPTPSLSSGVSAKCRDWIAKEIRDSSSSIDATAGYAACGDVSEAQMQKAIDEVEKELEASIAAKP